MPPRVLVLLNGEGSYCEDFLDFATREYVGRAVTIPYGCFVMCVTDEERSRLNNGEKMLANGRFY
jgi:hypothetical protein